MLRVDRHRIINTLRRRIRQNLNRLIRELKLYDGIYFYCTIKDNLSNCLKVTVLAKTVTFRQLLRLSLIVQ